MGKTIEPTKPPSKPSADDQVIIVHGDPNISDEQRQKNQAAIEWFRQRLEAAERMTPEERLKADQDWETFKNAVNDARGRTVIGDH